MLSDRKRRPIIAAGAVQLASVCPLKLIKKKKKKISSFFKKNEEVAKQERRDNKS